MEITSYTLTTDLLWVSAPDDFVRDSHGFYVAVADSAEPPLPEGWLAAVLCAETSEQPSLAEAFGLESGSVVLLQLKLPWTKAIGLGAAREVLTAAYQGRANLYPTRVLPGEQARHVTERGRLYEVGLQAGPENEERYRKGLRDARSRHRPQAGG